MFDSIGLKCVDDNESLWYGNINDYKYTCSVSSYGEKKQYSFYSNYNQDTLIGRLVDFAENKRQEDSYFLTEYEISNGHIELKFEAGENTLEIENFLKDFTELQKEISAKNCCAHCGKTEDLSFFRHSQNNGIFIMCNQCGENLSNQYILSQNQKGNYLKGFAGSLIGAIIGSILWIVLGSIGWIASIAGYAIAFCAIWGYKKLKGKMDKKGVIINIVTILIAFLIANFIGLYVIARKETGWNFGEFCVIFPVLMASKEVVFEVLKDLLIGAIFLFLGIKNTISDSLKKAKENFSVKIEKLD